MAGNAKPYLSAGLIASAAVAVLALYTGEQWLEPFTPFIIGAAAAFPLGFAGALLLHPEARSAPSLFLKFSVLLAVTVGIGVGVPALWGAPQVRIAALEMAGDHVNLRAAIADPDPNVQEAACHQMLGGALSIIDTSDELVDRPALAARCLSSADSRQTSVVAANLASDWHRSLVSREPAGESGQCLHAEALGALPVKPGVKKGRLLDCALSAPLDDNRVCCVDTLMQLGASCEELADQIDARVLLDGGSAGTLLALSHGEKTVRRQLKGVSRRLDLTCEEMQLVGLQLACASLDNRRSEQSNRVLEWLLEEHDGCMSPEERQIEAGVGEVCNTLIESLRRGGEIDDVAICEAQRDVVAEQQARLEQLRGPSAEESAALAHQIAAGRAQSDSRKQSYEQLIASMQGRPGAPSLESYSDADKKRIIEQMKKNAMSPEEAIAMPLEALDTVQAQYEKMSDKQRVQGALEDADEAPPEDLDDKAKEGRDKMDEIHERINSEVSEAKRKREQNR